ncbi:MAG: 5-deoxyadenosylcobinamide phosphate nucleotidyltransferase [Methanocorpusculum parvum]|nr:5-deoxyadenosylcobinamide phosphate nucleotidyltransferase [Methanocorpusculum parvum]
MLALILAGGEGSRLRLGEKALVTVANRPMLSWVIDAFSEAGVEPVVVTSHKTPFTRNFCRANDIECIDTEGVGYVEDMCEAVMMSGEEGPLFTAAADIPCLTAEIIHSVREAHLTSGKPACSTWIPISLCEEYGMLPRYREVIGGVAATPCALNILTGAFVSEVQEEEAVLLHEPGLAFNVNTREELAAAEKMFAALRK